MAGGFNFSIDFDSSQFKRGSDDAAASLEKLTDAMQDVERSDVSGAERSVDDLGDTADDTGRKADDLGEKFRDAFDRAREDARAAERSVDDVADATDDAGRKARDAGDELGGAFDDAADSARGLGDAVAEGQITADDLYAAEMKAELVQNFAESGAEAVRGFKDGFDAEDVGTIVDGITDTLVSMGAAAGPAGTAGALLASTIIQTFLGEWQEQQEDIASVASSVRDILVENTTGSFAHLPEEARIAFQEVRTQELLTKHGLEDIEQAADALGVTAGQVLAAMAGDTESAREVQQRYKEKVDEVVAASKKVGGTTAEAMSVVDGSVGFVIDSMGSLEKGVTQAEREYGALADAANEFEKEGTTGAANVADEVQKIKNRNVRVRVSDKGSARDTRRRVNDIKDREVTVKVRADTSSVYEGIAAAVAHAGRQTATIPVHARRVGGFYP